MNEPLKTRSKFFIHNYITRFNCRISALPLATLSHSVTIRQLAESIHGNIPHVFAADTTHLGRGVSNVTSPEVEFNDFVRLWG